MKISQEHVDEVWQEATIKQVLGNLLEEGYSVEKDQDYDGVKADIVARRGDEIRIFEFKMSGRSDPAAVHDISKLRKAAARDGAQLHLIIVRPPVSADVEFDGLEDILEEAVGREQPDGMEDLPSESQIETITDAVVKKVHVQSGEIDVEGEAVAYVAIIDEGEFIMTDSLPLEFSITTGLNGELQAIHRIALDTSSWGGYDDEDETGL
ncbi:MAG: hypothetical protein ACLGJC_03925 [Alphaproteobacteria bacterium]